MTAVITGERGDGHADALRPRGVRRRLRDRARPPRQRPDLDAAAAHRQVPRLAARHQRVPVPDRRARASRCCRSRRSGSTTRRPHERVSTGVAELDEMLDGKGFFRGSSVLVSGAAGHRQEQPRRALRRGRVRARRARPATSRTRSRRASSSATCARSASTSSAGRGRGCSASTPRGRRCRASSSTSSLMYDAVRRVRARASSSSTRSAT